MVIVVPLFISHKFPQNLMLNVDSVHFSPNTIISAMSDSSRQGFTSASHMLINYLLKPFNVEYPVEFVELSKFLLNVQKCTLKPL